MYTVLLHTSRKIFFYACVREGGSYVSVFHFQLPYPLYRFQILGGWGGGNCAKAELVKRNLCLKWVDVLIEIFLKSELQATGKPLNMSLKIISFPKLMFSESRNPFLGTFPPSSSLFELHVKEVCQFLG